MNQHTKLAILLLPIMVSLISPPAGRANAEPMVPGAPGNQAKFEAISTDLADKGFRGVIAITDTDGETFQSVIGNDVTSSDIAADAILIDTGSITKTVTAAAALKLVDRGQLSTADRLGTFFPDAPDDKARITVHQLLTHSSGLPAAVAADDSDLSKDDFLSRAWTAELLFAPGTGYEYSNVGYSLIAAIIEHVSGETYEAFIRNNVTLSSGAPSIGYELTYDASRSLLTKTGEDIATFSWGGRSHWALIGNGGLVATAGDILRVRRSFSEGKVVSFAAIDLAQTPHVREGDNAPSHYGYGMVVEDHPWFGRIYWHNGGNEQFLSNWTHYADAGFIVFTASNTPEFDADLAGLVIAEAIFDRKILTK